MSKTKAERKKTEEQRKKAAKKLLSAYQPMGRNLRKAPPSTVPGPGNAAVPPPPTSGEVLLLATSPEGGGEGHPPDVNLPPTAAPAASSNRGQVRPFWAILLCRRRSSPNLPLQQWTRCPVNRQNFLGGVLSTPEPTLAEGGESPLLLVGVVQLLQGWCLHQTQPHSAALRPIGDRDCRSRRCRTSAH